MQIFGGAGYTADAGIERFHRNARLFRIYVGMGQTRQTVIARGMVKEASCVRGAAILLSFHQHAARNRRGRRSRLDAELLEDMLEVLVHRARAHA